jgi:hypothetical protein
MSIECEFCHVIVQRASCLETHQSTTRKCLLIQKQLGLIPLEKLYECEYCTKKQTTKNNHMKHISKCKVKLLKENEHAQKKLSDSKVLTQSIEDKLEELASEFRNYKQENEYKTLLKEKTFENEIAELKKQIRELTKGSVKNIKNTNSNSHNKTNNSHNTTHITIQTVMTPERVEEFFKEHYKLDTLLEGQKGLARFVNDGFLKTDDNSTLYHCTDRSRNKFVMKQEDGSLKEDPNCEQLVHLTKPGLEHVSDLYETSLFESLPDEIKESDIHNSYRTISEMGSDRGEFKNELSKIISTEKKSDDIWERMKSKIMDEEKVTKEEMIPIPKPDICGISRGKLHVYKERYKKDGTVKYPPLFKEKIKQGDISFQKEYLEFLVE